MNGPWLRWLYNVSTKKIPKLEFFRFFATPKNCEACKRHRPTTQIPYKIHSMDLLFNKWIFFIPWIPEFYTPVKWRRETISVCVMILYLGSIFMSETSYKVYMKVKWRKFFSFAVGPLNNSDDF